LGNVNEARQLATNGIRFSPSPSYLLHLHERDKMNEKQLKEAMEATKEFKAYQVLQRKEEALLNRVELESQKSLPFYRALLKTPEWRAWTVRKRS